MKNIITDNLTLSTAAFCLWNISAKEKMDYCGKLRFNNIQIALSTIKMLHDFTDEIKNILQHDSFESISIQAPWCGVKYGNNKKTYQVLEKLRFIDQYATVDRYVFNFDSILDIDTLQNSGLKILIRNPVKPDSWHRFRSVIQHNRLSWAFDLNKAKRNDYDMEDMLDEIQESVEEIHVSGFIAGKNRMPIISTQQQDLLRPLSRFNTKNTPIIIEGLFVPNDFHSIVCEKNLIHSAIRSKNY